MNGVPLPIAVGLDSADARQAWHGKPVHIAVTDYGTLPIKVTTRTVTLGSKCSETTVKGVIVRPASFTLTHGQWKTVTVTVPHVPADYGVVFNGLPVNAKGLDAGTGIGAQILDGKGSCVVPTHHATAAPHGQAGLSGGVWVALVIVAVAILSFLVWLSRRRHHAH